MRCGYKSNRSGFISGDIAISSRRQTGAVHVVMLVEHLGGFAVVISSLQRQYVAFGEFRILFEL